MNTFRLRYEWYKARKELGYPISVWRASFGKFPRFSNFEAHEPGCPKWARRDYAIVQEYKEDIYSNI